MFRLDPVAAFEELFMKSPAAKVGKTQNVQSSYFLTYSLVQNKSTCTSFKMTTNYIFKNDSVIIDSLSWTGTGINIMPK